MSQQDSKRRNIGVIGTEDQIFGVEARLERSDLTLFGPALFIGAIGLFFLSGINALAGIGWVAVWVLGTATYVYACPDDEVPHERLAETLRFWRSEKELSTDEADPEKRSDSLSHVLRVRPDLGATQREDGALVGGMRINASSMALATGEQWESAVDTFAEWLSATEFPTEIAVGGDTVDPDIMTEGLDERLTDSDVQEVDALRDIIKTHQEEFPTEFRRRGTSVRTYHIYAAVRPDEARLDDHRAIAKLSKLPLVGGIIRTLGVGVSSMTPEELEEEQAKILDRRLKSINGGLMNVENCSPEQLTGDQHGNVIEAFWRPNSPVDPTARGESTNSRFAAGERRRVRETPRPTSNTEPDEATTATDGGTDAETVPENDSTNE